MISLLPVFGKICENIIYNFLINYFLRNKLKGESCIAQLLSILYATENVFDENPFLDISKEPDKVCHEGLIFRLNACDIEDDLLSLFENCLQNREQSFVLNRHTSE